MSGYNPCQYNGKTMLVSSFIILGSRVAQLQEYDIFDVAIDRFAEKRLSEIQENVENFQIFNDVDRGFSNTFKYFGNHGSEKVFLYAQILAQEDTEIILRAESSHNTKIWLNGCCITIHTGFWADHYYVKNHLKKGCNHLLIEKIFPQQTDILNVQLMNYGFETGPDFKALSNTGKNFVIDALMLKDKERHLPKEDHYRFLYLMPAESLFCPEYQVEIFDENKKTLKCFGATVNTAVCIYLAPLRNQIGKLSHYITIRCSFVSKTDNRIIHREHTIIIKSFEQQYRQHISTLERLAKCSDEDIACQSAGWLALLQKQEGNHNMGELYTNMIASCAFVGSVQAHCYQSNYYLYPGDYTFFIRSRLDQSLVQVKAHVPDAYDPKHSYPVIFMLMTGYGEFFSDWLELELLPEPILCFDVSGRGYTGGSYIGEASTMEIIDWVKAKYNIDENRVYLFGQSNGGFACYSIAQNHPSLPAAMFPMISYPNIKLIKNITNIPTYQVVSPKDYVFHGRENQVKNLLRPYKNYNQYDFKEMLHSYFRQYIAHRVLLKEITVKKRNPFPDTIYFKTQRNRHLQSYYLKLNGIRPGCLTASASCKITDTSHIHINLRNCDSLTVKIPPQIDRTSFSVQLNRSHFILQDFQEEKLIFVKKKMWKLAKEEPQIDFRKGTGLLDVYLNALTILTPENASEEILKLARQFSSPLTNGFFPETEAYYPIEIETDETKIPADKNLIILDTGAVSGLIKKLRNFLPVPYDETGYFFQGKRKSGDYVIMQIIANPKNNERSILIVSTNKLSFLSKHILLRKIILPTYCYGLHPYWNSRMLGFNGVEYFL